ncbi:MAG: peptidylprolyl isomerase [Terriglobia bacterium]
MFRFNQILMYWIFLSCLMHTPTFSQNQSPAATLPPKVSPETIVIQIGDMKVTAAEVERILQSMPPQFRPYYTGPGKRQFADIIVKNKLLFKEAEKRHLDAKEGVQLDLRISREAILSAAASNEIQSQMKPTDAEAQKYLEDHITQFEEARVSRIVVRSISSIPYGQTPQDTKVLTDQEALEKATDIYKKLADGADFEELAAKYSQDPLSSGKGGKLGFIRRGNKTHLVVPPLEEAIFSAKPGALIGPIQTALGFEIVKVYEKRIPKLEDIRKEIDPLIRAQKVDKWVMETEKGMNIEINEEFFKATPVSSMQGTQK